MSRVKRVTDDSILTVLAKVAGSKKLGQVLDTGRHHPFPARMPLALAEHLISELTYADAVILDPMVGSGTTLVAGKRLGRTCLGFDRDPLACLIARTAINEYRRSELESLRDRVFLRAKQIVRSVSVPDHRNRRAEEDQAFLKYWFPSHCQRQLFALSMALREERAVSMRELAAVGLSTLIIAKAAGASYAMDISRTRPHKSLDKPIVTPFDAWSRPNCAGAASATPGNARRTPSTLNSRNATRQDSAGRAAKSRRSRALIRSTISSGYKTGVVIGWRQFSGNRDRAQLRCTNSKR
jgi:hypothetical protein